MMSYTWEPDDAVDKAARSGDWEARHELDRREQRQRDIQQHFEAERSRGAGSSGADFGSYLVLIAPVVALVAIVAGIVRGTTWLATESPLAALFPGPASTTTEYVLASASLLVLLPVGVWLGGLWLHGTRARALSWLLFPLATVLVPVVLQVTQQTVQTGDPAKGAGLLSQVLGPVLLVLLAGWHLWRRTGARGIVGLHHRAQRAGRLGDLPRFVELQQRVLTRGLRSLGWQDRRMLEEALILAEGYKLLGHHPRAQHLTQITFEAARSQDQATVADLRGFAQQLGL